jgi:hypothetical protein
MSAWAVETVRNRTRLIGGNAIQSNADDEGRSQDGRYSQTPSAFLKGFQRPSAAVFRVALCAAQ